MTLISVLSVFFVMYMYTESMRNVNSFNSPKYKSVEKLLGSRSRNPWVRKECITPVLGQ